MKRIIYTSFLFPADRVDDTLLLLTLCYFFIVKKCREGKMGNRLQKLPLTFCECSSLLIQQCIVLANIWFAELNACSGSVPARVCQHPLRPLKHWAVQPVPAPAHHCHATGRVVMLLSQLVADIIPGDVIMSDRSLHCCSSLIGKLQKKQHPWGSPNSGLGYVIWPNLLHGSNNQGLCVGTGVWRGRSCRLAGPAALRKGLNSE